MPMFKIYDGREKFYQWDTERQLIIDDKEVREVHFCNRTDDCSLVVTTYEKDGLLLADVPNILLQNDWCINVYACGAHYTKYNAKFEVVKRSKPDDYIYNETELKTTETLISNVFKSTEFNANTGRWEMTTPDEEVISFAGVNPIVSNEYSILKDDFNAYPIGKNMFAENATSDWRISDTYTEKAYHDVGGNSQNKYLIFRTTGDKTRVATSINHNIKGEYTLEFDYCGLTQNGKTTDFFEVWLLTDEKAPGPFRIRVNYNGKNTIHVNRNYTTAISDVTMPNYTVLQGVWYRVKVSVSVGKIVYKIWKRDTETEVNAGVVELASEIISEKLVMMDKEIRFTFGIMNALPPTADGWQMGFDNVKVYRNIVNTDALTIQNESNGNEVVYLSKTKNSTVPYADKNFLKEYVKYYIENQTMMPVEIYYKTTTTISAKYEKVIHSTISVDGSYIIFYYYDESYRAMCFIRYSFDTNYNPIRVSLLNDIKNDWRWVDVHYSNLLNINSYGSTSHMKVVGYWNDDTQELATYTISTSHGNIFSQEIGTRYTIAEPRAERGLICFYNTMEFLDDDTSDTQIIRIETVDGQTINDFVPLGFYYWG